MKSLGGQLNIESRVMGMERGQIERVMGEGERGRNERRRKSQLLLHSFRLRAAAYLRSGLRIG